MNILIIDDEKSQRDILSDILEDAGYEVDSAENGTRGLEKIYKHNHPLVLTDLKMPGIDGISVLEQALAFNPDTQVILMTAFGTIPSAVNAIKNGAYDYLTKPFQKDHLLQVIFRAAEKAKLLQENRQLRDEMNQRYSYHNLIGASKAMRTIFNLIDRIKNVDATVLITGESGTGKELVAHAIHASSARKGGPFIALNCGAIPDTLIESELFGYEKGAFTGAMKNYSGKFEQAQNGTIFLDEIGVMPLHLQIRLLRVLQEKEVERLGGNKSINLNVRVIAATNEDLRQKIETNSFRLDLFHRLNVFSIHLPPLRERKKDIPLLADFFLNKLSTRYNKPLKKLTPGALYQLESYHFPGNVRELENVIEKSIILSDGDTITENNLMLTEMSDAVSPKSQQDGTLPQVELNMIVEALRKSHGSIKEAAKILGITYKTMQYRIKKFKLNKKDFKDWE